MSPEPTKSLTVRCLELYDKRHDIPFIASVLGVPLVNVSRILRNARVATNVQPHELSYIVENIDTMPARAIAEYLGLSTSQLDQILRRFKIRQRLKSNVMTLEVCVAKTRWLIDTQLKLPVDDQLPRLITNEPFTDNGLNAVLEFATESKTKDSTARHFSTCAFLVGQAYPNRFKPWQFRHAKQNQYFTGRGGRKRFLEALMWLIETKLDVSSKALPAVFNSQSFLSTHTLQYFGLGPHWWRPHLWPNKAEMLQAVAKHAGIVPDRPVNRRTAQGRPQLQAAGIDLTCCAVPGCSIVGAENIEVHHIVRRATRVTGRFDLHSADNLVPLCRHHHGVAGRFRPDASLLRTPMRLRPWLIGKLGANTAAPLRGEP